MSKELKTNVFDILQAPFKYDSYGQKVFDKNNNLVLDVRAWGLLQYEENGEELQDSFGEKVVEGLNYIANKKVGDDN